VSVQPREGCVPQRQHGEGKCIRGACITGRVLVEGNEAALVVA
jgi:hypothetical protein